MIPFSSKKICNHVLVSHILKGESIFSTKYQIHDHHTFHYNFVDLVMRLLKLSLNSIKAVYKLLLCTQDQHQGDIPFIMSHGPEHNDGLLIIFH